MKVAISGITPMGCTIAAFLSEAGEDVCLLGPPEKIERIYEKILTVRQVWDGRVISVGIDMSPYPPFEPDVLVMAERVQDTLSAAEKLLPYCREATVASVQEGTKTEQILARVFPRDNIVTCVLTLGAHCAVPGEVTINFKGFMVVGKAYAAPAWREDIVMELMSKAFSVRPGKKIAHFNCTRLLLNLPYCIPGIIGESVQNTFMDPEMAEAAVLLLKEGMKIIRKAGVHIEALPDMDDKSLHDLIDSPLHGASRKFMESVASLSGCPCEGPVLGSLERGEPSEVDYQNGELVKIANALGRDAPLNELMVRLVHQVEKSWQFMPKREFLYHFRKTMPHQEPPQGL